MDNINNYKKIITNYEDTIKQYEAIILSLENNYRQMEELKDEYEYLQNLFYENTVGNLNTKLENILGNKFENIIFKEGKIQLVYGDYWIILCKNTDSTHFKIIYFENKGVIIVYENLDGNIFDNVSKIENIPNKIMNYYNHRDEILKLLEEAIIYQDKFII